MSHPESKEFSSYSSVKIVFFLKSRLLKRILFFLYVCKQTFRMFKVRISEKVKGVIMRNLRCTFFI